MEPKTYWLEVCSPVLKQRRDDLKRAGEWKSQSDIAAEVSELSGKPSERALVGHWISGEREPYTSQAVALCSILKIRFGDLMVGKLTLLKVETGRQVFATGASIPARSLGKTGRSAKHLKEVKRYK